MKDKKRNCLVFLVLFICLTVCAQSSDKVKAMRNLRDYYTQNINTYDINQDMGKWDLYLKQLSEEGQFADLAAYEKKIHDNNWLSSVSFQDQQDIGFYLADTFRRLWVIANHYRQTNVNDIPERFWKSILRYGDIEVRRQPNDRFHASCFAIPKAACGIYFSLVGQMDLPDDTKPLRKSACRMLKALAMQSWTQPLRNNEMDRDIVRVERFRHHVWWVGGNALAYRPLLETAVLMDSIPMVDVVAEVAKRSLSNVSQILIMRHSGTKVLLPTEPDGTWYAMFGLGISDSWGIQCTGHAMDTPGYSLGAKPDTGECGSIAQFLSRQYLLSL